MTQDDPSREMKRITIEVAKNKKDVLDEIFGYGELSDTYRDITDVIIDQEGYTRQTVYDARIEQKRDELDTVLTERDRLDERADSLREEINKLREDRENLLSQEDEYRGALKSLEQELRREPDYDTGEGTLSCVWPGHPKVQRLATEYDKQADGVHADLRERNPDLPDDAFTQGTLGQSYDGLPPKQARLSVDEREDAR